MGLVSYGPVVVIRFMTLPFFLTRTRTAPVHFVFDTTVAVFVCGTPLFRSLVSHKAMPLVTCANNLPESRGSSLPALPHQRSVIQRDQMADNNSVFQDLLRPFSLRYPPSMPLKQCRAVYEGQVHAFFEASEIVDMEEDVLDDILDGFDDFDHETSSNDVTDEQSFTPGKKLDRDTAGHVQLLLPYGFYVYFGPHGIATHITVHR
jgi:hypothetical protein